MRSFSLIQCVWDYFVQVKHNREMYRHNRHMHACMLVFAGSSIEVWCSCVLIYDNNYWRFALLISIVQQSQGVFVWFHFSEKFFIFSREISLRPVHPNKQICHIYFELILMSNITNVKIMFSTWKNKNKTLAWLLCFYLNW